ncbi:MAG: topoisomerase C-terminal repeat-containing protein, partial [Pseudomonadota bacterium]
PRLVGQHPEDAAPIEAAIGRFGPYVKHNSTYANLPDVEDVFTIGMNRAVEVLAQKLAGRPGRGAVAVALKELGEHPDGGAISIMPGKYGPYVKWAKVNATIPKTIEPEALSLEDALALIAEKAGKAPAKKPARKAAAPKAAAKPKADAKPKTAAAKTTATKTTAAKAVAKKPAVKKAVAKKPAVEG